MRQNKQKLHFCELGISFINSSDCSDSGKTHPVHSLNVIFQKLSLESKALNRQHNDNNNSSKQNTFDLKPRHLAERQ